jgi:hypothetical protein
MSKARKEADELMKLTQRLQRIQREWLIASRKGDFRAVARLTAETAQVNRAIREAEGGQMLALDRLGDTLFSGDAEIEDEEAFAFEEQSVA